MLIDARFPEVAVPLASFVALMSEGIVMIQWPCIYLNYWKNTLSAIGWKFNANKNIF